MMKLTINKRLGGLLALTALLSLPAATADAQGKGRLSPASLDLDTPGCPTTFGDPECEKRTSWTLDKSIPETELNNPDGELFIFHVTVTEGPTGKILSGDGQIVITNSGELSATLSSIAINLEALVGGGTGDAPGPSGKNWKLLATAIATESSACDLSGVAETCYGTLTESSGASLVLFDADNNDIIALSDLLPIPPSLDDDGDGLRDEDPADGIDNDGDGLIDEDGPCDANKVVINFEYEFDITGLGIEGPGDGIVPSDDDLRIDLIATFGSAGKRGGGGASCTLDANCNGVIDDDDLSTPLVNESETKNIRSIQQRLRFDPVACTPTCQTVTLTDDGAAAADETCVAVTTSTLNETIDATEVEGTESAFTVEGHVTCIDGDCSTTITNTAVLTCDDNSLIEGSPASASFDVVCSVDEPPEDPDIGVGDFCSQTQGGWGSVPRGNNTGKLLHNNFAAVFPGNVGVIVGDPDGPDADGDFAILLKTAQAGTDYLPAGGTPAALTADQTNPLTTSSGVFGAQMVAATLNVAFDLAGIGKLTPQRTPPPYLGDLVYVAGCVDDDLVGLSVNQVLALANTAISGGGTPAGVTISDLSDALATLNENFVDCDTNLGCLALPAGSPKSGASSQSTTPGAYELSQNHPNPFNPTTEISFTIPEAGEVKLVIYNVAGQVVRTLVSGQLVAGTHRITWNATDDSGIRVANGVFLYVLEAGSTTLQKRLVLLK